MRLLMINPNTSEEFTRSMQESAEAVKAPGTELVCVNPSAGPRSIESAYDELLSTAPCLELIIQRQAEFDGFIIACYGNHPAVYGAREMLHQPVVGIMEASLHLAYIVGQKFSIIGSGDRTVTLFREAVRALDMEARCASIRSTGTPVLALEGSEKMSVEELILAESRKAVEEDGAEVISLGCAGMTGLDKRLSQELGVPVIDGVAAAVKMIEALVSCGIQTSKRCAYGPLAGKELVNMPAAFSAAYTIAQNPGGKPCCEG